MSERNVELWRSWIADFNARDIEAIVRRCDPGIEFHSVFAAVGGASYRGHDGLRAWHQDLEEAWGEEIQLEIEAYFDLGETTLTFFIYHVRGKQSRAAVAMPATVITRWRDGLVTYMKVYVERADALKDLGVSEDELEEIAP